MTLSVDTAAVRAFAAKLREALAYAEAGQRYVNANGNFGVSESGLIGYIVPQHRAYMDALNNMLSHLERITDASETSMVNIARTYEHTDKHSAQAMDASYPEVTRPPANPEPQADNYPQPQPYKW
jgi:hypothetical protein